MKQKTRPIPCHYIIDKVTIDEISDSFRHLFSELENFKLLRIYEEKKWDTIFMNKNDALEISKICGLTIELFNIYGYFRLNVKVSEMLPEGEILFS